MQNVLMQYYLNQPEPNQSCLLALSEVILQQDENITTTLKYGMPFFCYKGKMFCYLWVHKKLDLPYIGFVEGKHLHHPDLQQEKRSRMKTILVDPNKDLPVKTIITLFKEAIALYQNGTIRIKKS